VTVKFSEDCVRFGDRLRALVEAGVAVKEAAVTLGLSGRRCCAILRATGHPMGASRARRGRVDREQADRVEELADSEKQKRQSERWE
jgi:IS30 family transposase